jgi:hypothetical protein
MSKKNVVRRGRPSLFNATAKKSIVSLIKKHGLTGTAAILAETGVRNGGETAEPIVVSIPTLGNIARAAGLELKRGRPVGSGASPVVEAKPAKKAKKSKAVAKKGKKAVGKKPGRPAKVAVIVPEVAEVVAPVEVAQEAVA